MATRTSITSGLWSSASTWDTKPVDGDDVVIDTGHTVTFDEDHSGYTSGINNITIRNTSTLKINETNPNSSQNVSSITRSSNTATVNCSGHGYSNGDVVYINGANQAGYNGKFTISGVATDSFTVQVDSGLTTPATGTITVRKVVFYKMKITGQIAGTGTSGHTGNFEAGSSGVLPPHIMFSMDMTGGSSITVFRKFYGNTNKTLLVNW